jgi:hypothetical protein
MGKLSNFTYFFSYRRQYGVIVKPKRNEYFHAITCLECRASSPHYENECDF